MTKNKLFSSNLVQFHETESEFEHYNGRLVKFMDTFLAIGGGEWDFSSGSAIFEATVDIFNETMWEEKQDMSPVNGLTKLAYFSTLAIGDDLFIFG